MTVQRNIVEGKCCLFQPLDYNISTLNTLDCLPVAGSNPTGDKSIEIPHQHATDCEGTPRSPIIVPFAARLTGCAVLCQSICIHLQWQVSLLSW